MSKSNALQNRLDAALKLNAEKAVENYVAKALNADFKSTLLPAEETKATTAIGFAPAAEQAALTAKVNNAKDVRADYDAVVKATIANVPNGDLTPGQVQTNLKTAINPTVATKGTVKDVELTNLPKDNAKYAAGAELKAKVTFEKGDAKMAANITATLA